MAFMNMFPYTFVAKLGPLFLIKTSKKGTILLTSTSVVRPEAVEVMMEL
jgi:hypothetical protein